MKHHSTHLFFSLIAIAALQSCGQKNKTQTASIPESIPVRTMILSKTQIQVPLHLSGQLTTDDETYMSFKTGGIIRSIRVKEGDAIHRGQVLATLDLTEISAQVEQAKLNEQKSRRDFERISRLFKDSVATLEQLQNSQTNLSLTQRQLESAEFNRSFSEIRALTNGFVLKKIVNEGQVVTAGASVLLTNGAGSRRWIVRCGVSDRDWASIRLNDPAQVTVETISGKIIAGIVTRRSEGTDPATGSFSIDVSVGDPARVSMATGMFAKVTVIPKESADVWTIPYDALLDGDAGQGYVFTTDDNKIARKIAVRIGKIERDHVQVTGGLENSKAVIISGNAYLADSSFITLLN